jgi:hypothetical protein
LNTGETRTEAVAKQLESLFGDNPTIGYDYEQYIEKVVQLPDKNRKSAADNFGLF